MKQSGGVARTFCAILLGGLYVCLAHRMDGAQALASGDRDAGPKPGGGAKTDAKKDAILNIYTGKPKPRKRTRKIKRKAQEGQPAMTDDEAMAVLYPHAFQRMQQNLPVTLAGQGTQKTVFQTGDKRDLTEGEIIEEEVVHDPKEAIERDNCCIRGSAQVADHATNEGSYKITVVHSGLSLKHEDGRCQKSLPRVEVTYLCPTKCYLKKQSGAELMAYVKNNPDSSDEQFERCDSHECDGICYNPNDGSWHLEAVVSVDAPRLNECTVLGGGPEGNQVSVMDSNCVGSFEAWRQSYQAFLANKRAQL